MKKPHTFTTLIAAIMANNGPALQQILLDGVDPNGYEDEAMVTPLHFAAQYNAQACAEVLLFAGADVTAETQDGLTPIDVALLHEYEEMAELLSRGITIIRH
jgi:ankyrin repeat protein